MFKKSVVNVVCICFSIVALNASAAVVSLDWKNAGDNLITRDLETGLDWLDLTETNNRSYNFVSSQLGAGGYFEGFRYATSAEVVALWSNFAIDLSPTGSGTIETTGLPQGLVDASNMLGNILHDAYPSFYSYGLMGMTGDELPYNVSEDTHFWMGAFHEFDSDVMTVFPINAFDHGNPVSSIGTGSYLVATTTNPPEVPVPAAVWLFGSGLLSLVAVARREKTV